MTEALELLCTGDLHLGRHPTRIPEELDGPALSPKAVWLSIVQHAIDTSVDAVVITSDVVDQENRYFEAYGAFENGVGQLADEDIPVVVVAGNHDHDALPDLVDNLDADTLQFLGRGGEWERWTLKEDGDPLLHFDGWSFPAEHVYESPLDEYNPPTADDAPLIGVLHADLDARGSDYAPVQSSDLRDTPAEAWLLGHIHAPGIRNESDPLVLYPGSPQPLDPGEQGAHGPWMVTITSEGVVSTEQVPLATVRYDAVDVDVSGVESSQEATSALSSEIETRVRSEFNTRALELSLVRARLTGRTNAHRALVDDRRTMERDLGFREGSVSVRLESIEIATRPALNLDDLADGENAAAYLANLLLDIENGDPQERYPELIGDSLEALHRAQGANAYTPLRREVGLDDPEEADAIAVLEQEARVLLDTLLAQKEGA